MPSKKKIARKVKREVKRKVQRVKAQQQQQQQNNKNTLNDKDMMLKLMAMMGGRGGQQAMDPATLLNLREEKAKKEQEDIRLKRDAKAAEQQYKEEAKQAKNEYEKKMAEMKAEMAKQKAEHDKEILALRAQELGLEGEEKLKQQELDQAKHDLKIKQGNINLDAATVRVENLKRNIKSINQSIDLIQPSPEVRALVKMLQDRNEHIATEWSELYDALRTNELTKVERDRLKKLVDDLAEQEYDMIKAKQQIDFELKEYQEAIKQNNERVDKYRDIVKEINDKKYELENAKIREKYSGLLYNMDADGNAIETFDKSKLVEEIEPEDDPKYKKYYKKAADIRDHLDTYLIQYGEEKLGDKWFDLKQMREESPEEFHQYLTQYCFGGEHEKILDGDSYEVAQEKLKKGKSTNRYKKPNGDYILWFNDLADYMDKLNTKGEKAYEEAKERLKQAREHNAKIRELPEPIKPTNTLLQKKIDERDELVEEIAKRMSKAKACDDLNEKIQMIEEEIKMLTAQRDAIPDYEVDEEFVKTFANKERERDSIKRDIEVRKHRERKVNDIIDQTNDLEFDNHVETVKGTESPASKTKRENNEEEAIKALVKARRDKELNEIRGMTYNAEREARMGELQANAMRSEEIKAIDEKIIEEEGKAIINKEKKKRQDEWSRKRAQVRESYMAHEAQRIADEELQRTEGIGDFTAVLQAIDDKRRCWVREMDERDQWITDTAAALRSRKRILPHFNHYLVETIKEHPVDNEDLESYLATEDGQTNVNNFLSFYKIDEIPPSDDE